MSDTILDTKRKPRSVTAENHIFCKSSYEKDRKRRNSIRHAKELCQGYQILLRHEQYLFD
jgi:hypothetical protein